MARTSAGGDFVFPHPEARVLASLEGLFDVNSRLQNFRLFLQKISDQLQVPGV